jgi:hypothetical protein
VKCQRCGEPTTDIHSGEAECPDCWTFRKLDLPAAQHWNKVAKEFLSNVDLHDMQTYLPKALSSDERVVSDGTTYGELLRAVQAVWQHSERVLKEGPYHMWKDRIDGTT